MLYFLCDLLKLSSNFNWTRLLFWIPSCLTKFSCLLCNSTDLLSIQLTIVLFSKLSCPWSTSNLSTFFWNWLGYLSKYSIDYFLFYTWFFSLHFRLDWILQYFNYSAAFLKLSSLLIIHLTIFKFSYSTAFFDTRL